MREKRERGWGGGFKHLFELTETSRGRRKGGVGEKRERERERERDQQCKHRRVSGLQTVSITGQILCLQITSASNTSTTRQKDGTAEREHKLADASCQFKIWEQTANITIERAHITTAEGLLQPQSRRLKGCSAAGCC